MLLTDEIATVILRAGGGLRISSKAKFPATLVQFAQLAAHSGARLEIIVETPMFPNDLQAIAAAGKGRVLFDFIART